MVTMRIGSMICGAESYEGCDEERGEPNGLLWVLMGKSFIGLRWLHWGGLRIH